MAVLRMWQLFLPALIVRCATTAYALGWCRLARRALTESECLVGNWGIGHLITPISGWRMFTCLPVQCWARVAMGFVWQCLRLTMGVWVWRLARWAWRRPASMRVLRLRGSGANSASALVTSR